MKIPRRDAITLTGHAVTVPTGFTGARNFVFMTFEPSHFVLQPSWWGAMRSVLSDCDPRTGFYTLSLITPTGGLRRRLAAWALRLDVSDPFLQEHTALLFSDRRAWQRDAEVLSLADPIAAVATPDGDVLRRVRGAPSPVSVHELTEALHDGS